MRPPKDSISRNHNFCLQFKFSPNILAGIINDVASSLNIYHILFEYWEAIIITYPMSLIRKFLNIKRNNGIIMC